jgi:hypothetical protein
MGSTKLRQRLLLDHKHEQRRLFLTVLFELVLQQLLKGRLFHPLSNSKHRYAQTYQVK